MQSPPRSALPQMTPQQEPSPPGTCYSIAVGGRAAMNNVSLVLLVLAAFLVGAAVAFFAYRAYREREAGRIRSHFGPEYERLAGERGVHAAEKELAQREKRAASFDIRPLAAQDRRLFQVRWQDV